MVAGTPEFILFTFILMRISGFILLNPVFGRRNIPGTAKAGMILMISLVTYQMAMGNVLDLEITSPIVYGLYLIKEFLVGFVLGFTMYLFDFAITFAGSVIDFQMGMSMSTVFDAQNGTQMALTGKILQIYFLLLFFAVDGHLALMNIIVTSGQVLPYGAVTIGPDVARGILDIFTQCVILAVKLAFPIIAIEFIVEVAVGILMKMIPQINLFILSIELRILFGLVILMLFISPIGSYLGDLINNMLNTIPIILERALE